MRMEQDFVLRAIRQLVKALARIFALAKSGREEEALIEVSKSSVELLGMEFEVLTKLDAVTVIDLLGSPQRAHVYLVLVESLAALKPEPERPQWRAYAAALAAEMKKRWPQSSAELQQNYESAARAANL